MENPPNVKSTTKPRYSVLEEHNYSAKPPIVKWRKMTPSEKKASEHRVGCCCLSEDSESDQK